MNVSQQLEKSDPPADLSAATLGDLIRELKMRCNAVVVVMAVDDDEDGGESNVVFRLGSRLVCLGALEEAKQQILDRGFSQES